MIVANVRHRLTRNDAQLAMSLIARDSSRERDDAEAALRDAGLDALLDDPRLLEGLVRTPAGAAASWPLFCYVVVRHALRAHAINDRTLADYVAAELEAFAWRDRAHRIAPTDDERYETLADLVRDSETADARRAYLIRVHLGNYALWLAGCFPDRIEARRHRRGGPDLDYYDALGARGYALAAEHRLAHEQGLSPLFAEAARRYVALRIALNAVSDTLFFPDRHTPDRLLRQVRDDARWRLAS
ncbi:MAG: hypothetical protein ACK5Z1_04070 [Gemmatimonadota bacterium]